MMSYVWDFSQSGTEKLIFLMNNIYIVCPCSSFVMDCDISTASCWSLSVNSVRLILITLWLLVTGSLI